MRKEFLPPLAVIAAMLAFILWNTAFLSDHTDHWRHQLEDADTLARAEEWDAAEQLLRESYQDWSAQQSYLHIISEHDLIDDAEAMYRRAMAFASIRESSEFRAELADLQDQLHLLSVREQFSLQNIL